MNWRSQWWVLALMVGLFLLFFYMPVEQLGFTGPVLEALALARWYAREHVILCLIPAFFIAGAIAVFVSQAAVMKYLGARANKVLSYGVASVSGGVLAVCSCTVLPLFAGIYRMGAGIGPATAFLYAGPAVNVLAIVLTAKVLGLQLGVARAVGAVVFSVVIGLLMHLFFLKEEREKLAAQMALPEQEVDRPLWQNGLYFTSLIAILVFANWGRPDEASGFFSLVYHLKWWLTGLGAVGLGAMLLFWFRLPKVPLALTALAVGVVAWLVPDQPMLAFVIGVIGLSVLISRRSDETGDWFEQSWGFAKQIMPLLLIGVIIAGLLLGRPGHEGLIPSGWIAGAVGG
ncbi:hypothetical protein GF356_01135, partial [candidate division GN15 bacterium]|nr:hypothetical protein [candidate division GN15 bacterium]